MQGLPRRRSSRRDVGHELLASSSGSRSRPMNRNSVRNRPTPSAACSRSSLDRSGIVDVEHHLDALAARRSRPGACSRAVASASSRRRAVQPARHSARASPARDRTTSRPSSPSSTAVAALPAPRPRLTAMRHATRARQHRHVRRRAAALQRHAAQHRPVERQEARWGQIVADDDAARQQGAGDPRCRPVRAARASPRRAGRWPARGSTRPRQSS